MDLIYTNASLEDIGVLHDYSFDLAFGSDENDFELKIASQNHCCEPGGIVYIDGTEYGGIVDAMKVSTKADELTYKGRTWHGILASKILSPDAGADYLTVSGEANAVIGSLLNRTALSGLFVASSDASGLTINNYRMNRYIDAYSGIMKALETVGGKLHFAFRDGKVVLSAVPAVDYTKDEQFDEDQVEMDIEKTYRPVNHLICLGKGDLAERQVVHLYMDASGNISGTQTFFGLDEVAAVYDNSNAESLEDLIKGGKERFLESAAADKANMDFAAEEKVYDIGDIVGAVENTTKISIKSKITKKIVSIKNGTTTIQYKVGEGVTL